MLYVSIQCSLVLKDIYEFPKIVLNVIQRAIFRRLQDGDGCSARLMVGSTMEEPPPTVMEGITSQGTHFEKKIMGQIKAVQQKNVLVNHEVKVEVVEGT